MLSRDSIRDCVHRAADWLPPALLLTAAAALRLLGAGWHAGSRNPDYGIVVLMARHIAEGRPWPVFFYGQAYMGSLEPTLSAALVRLFGPAPFVVCLGTVLAGLLVLVAVHRWARALGGATAGAAALLLAAVGPTGYFQYMVSPRGGYALGLLLTVLLLHDGARMARQARATGTLRRGHALRLGLLAGLGFWNFWLTLPAAATAALLLWAGLRGRLPRLRVWAAGLGGFAAGSLPFWTWNAAHGWTSFGAQQMTGGPRQFLRNVALLPTDRLPLLLDLEGRGRVAALAVAAGYGLLLCGALAALRPRRRTVWDLRAWSLAGIVLYAGIFAVAFGLSSFCIARTPRYLLPFVPLFAVLAGAGLAGASPGGAGSRWRPLRAGRLLGFGALCAALAGVVGFQCAQLPRRSAAHPWIQGAREIAADLATQGTDAAMADFLLHGFNWATDERLCCSSPQRERYPPFARRLEAARQPAVLENYQGFDHFLAATGTQATFRRVGGFRLHAGAQPPATAVVPVPRRQLAAITDAQGCDRTEALTDLFFSTLVTVMAGPDNQSWLEVAFAEPVRLCGVRAWIAGKDGFADWSVEGRAAPGAPFRTLSEPHVLTGYFWSGERFYHGGGDWREEKRFAPSMVTTLRIRFHPRNGRSHHRISELQLLREDGPATLPDPAAVAAAVRAGGITRLYADRWLANRVHDLLDGAVWTSREPSVFGPENGETWVRIAPGTAIAADPDTVESVRVSLRRIGLAAREEEPGGLTLFVLPEAPHRAADYRGLRFRGKLLAHAHHRALADFLWKEAAGLPSERRTPALRAALAEDPGAGEVLHELAELAARAGHAADVASLQEGLLPLPGLPLDATFFRERLRLLRLTFWPATCRAGDRIAFETEWHLEEGFRIPGDIGLFVHFLRNGQIAFQMDTPLVFQTAPFDPDLDIETSLHHVVTVPETVAPGPLVPVLGLYHYGALGWREAVRAPHPIRQRRVQIPGPFEVLP